MRAVLSRKAGTTFYIALAENFAAVRLDLDFDNLRLLCTGKCRVLKAAMGTVRVWKRVVFFDDGKVRTLSAPVAAAPSLLSPRAFDSLRRLLLDGLVDRLALLGEEAVSEITDLCFFEFYFVFEKSFAFRSPYFILLNCLFKKCFASARPLMESFPIIRSQLELS